LVTHRTLSLRILAKLENGVVGPNQTGSDGDDADSDD